MRDDLREPLVQMGCLQEVGDFHSTLRLNIGVGTILADFPVAEKRRAERGASVNRIERSFSS